MSPFFPFRSKCQAPRHALTHSCWALAPSPSGLASQSTPVSPPMASNPVDAHRVLPCRSIGHFQEHSMRRLNFMLFPITLGLLTLLLSMGCAGNNQNAGGACDYLKYPATFEVTDLKPHPTRGYWVFYTPTFTDKTPNQSFYSPKNDGLLVIRPDGVTDLDWLSTQKITVGSKWNMELWLISNGSCTPVMHKSVTMPYVVQ